MQPIVLQYNYIITGKIRKHNCPNAILIFAEWGKASFSTSHVHTCNLFSGFLKDHASVRGQFIRLSALPTPNGLIS